MTWYEDDVKRVEKEIADLRYKPETIFYGSSSITLWKTLYEDFEEFKPVNLGFGGSTLSACVWFFERIMKPITTPVRVIIYAGDNDLGDGRMPHEVFLFYRQLIALIRARYGNIPVYYISIKPSLSRWEIIDRIKLTNELIEAETKTDVDQHFINIFSEMLNYQNFPRTSLFEPDGLHLSPKGYTLWKSVLMENIFEN